METNVTYNPAEIDTLSKWMKRFRQSEDETRPLRERGVENYKLYKSWREGKATIYKHNIFVPYTFALVEDLAAYFMLSLVAADKIYTITPRYNAISQDACTAIETLLNWAIADEKSEFILEMEEVLKNISLYGVGYLINFPVAKGDSRQEFDYLYLDAPHTFQVYPEPGVKRLSRARWVIKQSFETMENIRDWEAKGIYENVSALLKGGDTSSEEDPVRRLMKQVGLSPVQFDENRIELWDCFEGGDVITIANRRVIIRDTRKDIVRPYLFDTPLLDARMSGAPGEFFGIGHAESIKPLQRELNLLRSQRRDNIALVLNKVFKYNMLAGEVDLSTLFSAPGNVIIEQGDAIEELPVTDVTASSYKEEESLLYDIQNVLSFWDYSRGATPRRRETATGIIRLQQAAQSRNEWHLRKLDEYIFRPLAKRLMVYLRDGLSRDMAIQIVGDELAPGVDEFMGMDIEQLKRVTGVKPLTESISSIKEIEMNNFMMAFDRLIQLPGVNVPVLVKMLLQKLGQKNINEIMGQLSPDAQQQTMMGMQQLQQMLPEQMGMIPGMQGQAPPAPIPGMPGM